MTFAAPHIRFVVLDFGKHMLSSLILVVVVLGKLEERLSANHDAPPPGSLVRWLGSNCSHHICSGFGLVGWIA